MKLLNVASVIFCLIGFQFTIQAQTAVTASGGNASGSGTVSYSVGQVAYTTSSGSNGSVARGVQQPYEISVITGIEQANDITLFCSVYPNPVGDILTLKVENYSKENLSYELFDANGKFLGSKKVTGNETTISMGNMLPSLYILKVTDNQKEIKIFKIIKN